MSKKISYIFQRVEKKYCVTGSQLDALLHEISPHITADEYGVTSICNIYYDTPTNELIRRSIEKPVYKEKLRIRSYGIPKETDTVFVELKKKFKGTVFKRRAAMTYRQAKDFLDNGTLPFDSQIIREITYFTNFYHPSPALFLAYDRVAYLGNQDKNIRITVDSNLRSRREKLDFAFGDTGEKLLTDDLFIVEIKVPAAYPIWLTNALNSLKIYPVSFSKYGNIYKKERFEELCSPVSSPAQRPSRFTTPSFVPEHLLSWEQ
ncbi:MAG: polyphosphate polymerase domain-containing protein [Clostridia bacterium]|nr:polyphosphate polymerase domain-containing protein [Clostridia bacterium]